MSDYLSPCIGVCRLDERKRMCVGCGRMAQEIYDWVYLDNQEKTEIAWRAAERLLLTNESILKGE